MQINGKKVINAEVDGVDPNDYPDFADAYICYAEFENGDELSDDEIEYLNDEYPDVVNEMAFEHYL